ncbi:META domain-containing protein [Bradyrhizobium sp.]|jgi:hypothetical protein|uniref:META domain-containing protein n=1 Tax=Bradyrhizobium sp. TaxID=376 RepID=UPI003BB05AD4
MRFLLTTWTLLGAIVACSAQVVSFEDPYRLAGRWELTSTDMPIALRRGKYVVIESRTIKIKRDCNEVTLGYSVKGDELSATPISATLVTCYPPNIFADESRLVYGAFLHSKYQIDGDVLRLFSPKDSAFDYSLEFHRIR